jgi:predicted small secreted protein
MTWLQLILVLLLATLLAGCELAGGIFKAGAWVGAMGVIVVVLAVALIAMKIKG